jgi:alkanesulfonate monooxygenase SsuD/methylene tetrahydromethanopterin reductase-like flavin-dependent oxidoreductase (luciferase family)
MRYGFVLPGGSASEQLELGVVAEESGWDGIFAYETSYSVDPWTLLAAMAQRTRRLRLGTMLTPVPWRRPWKLASQVLTLDQLSNGRAILAVGTGATDPALGTTGEEANTKIRAERMDEAIDLMRGLWEGRLEFSGQHYAVDLSVRANEIGSSMQPAQQRIPIWVVGAWPRSKSMRRVLRCDGLLPLVLDDNGMRTTTPDDIRAICAWLTEHGAKPGIDIISEGETEPDASGPEQVKPWAEAGCTWWLETRWMLEGSPEEQLAQVRERIRGGPPRISE